MIIFISNSIEDDKTFVLDSFNKTSDLIHYEFETNDNKKVIKVEKILSDVFKFIIIVMCFFISLMIGKNKLNDKDVILLQFGLFFTVLSDFFFLIVYKNSFGVASFCIVQILYCIRYDIDNTKETIRNFILIFIFVAILYIIFSRLIKKINVILFIGLYYSICLITSVWKAIKACKNNNFPSPNRYMIAYGMILFLLCDINVFLHNIIGIKNSKWLVWLFYIPSQFLLSFSGYKFKRKSFR
ncbi:lysoplasmalogenase family protein [Anaerosalibacter sp. Marseille-P3206]|uniref:lysoplasmalogenase family protein n=1 Tax=Anaerosalibacter sp. Marseille-P3206 TaxID=1871005 RepID=UPI000984602E|nr:lysoplasmalogenase family protein [Anaerosalibacter sp. Marseille-P3206]